MIPDQVLAERLTQNFYSPADAARALGMTARQMRRLVNERQIPSLPASETKRVVAVGVLWDLARGMTLAQVRAQHESVEADYLSEAIA